MCFKCDKNKLDLKWSNLSYWYLRRIDIHDVIGDKTEWIEVEKNFKSSLEIKASALFLATDELDTEAEFRSDPHFKTRCEQIHEEPNSGGWISQDRR